MKPLARILRTVALGLAATAALVIFVAVPAEWLDRWHVLSGWIAVLIIVVVSPFIIAWGRIGIYLLVIVVLCEVTLVYLKPRVRRAWIEAMAAVGVCALTYLYFYIAFRFNFH